MLPIVFYDGADKWTAETNFLNKTELSDVFEKYIPMFEYELVDLSKYGERDIASFGNTLSLIMIIDKIRTPDGISILSKLPDNYIEELKQNIPPHLNKLLADVITVFLTRIDVPADEIEKLRSTFMTGGSRRCLLILIIIAFRKQDAKLKPKARPKA